MVHNGLKKFGSLEAHAVSPEAHAVSPEAHAVSPEAHGGARTFFRAFRHSFQH